MDAVESKTTRQLTADEVLSFFDELVGENPWVRLGVSTAVGIAAGLVGPRVLRTGIRFAFAMSARRLARMAFDAAFEAGQRDGAGARFGGQRMAVAQAADRSY